MLTDIRMERKQHRRQHINDTLNGIDEVSIQSDVAQIVRQMLKLRDEYHTGIIVVTHNLGVAAYMADRIVVMKEGRIVDAGTRDQILNHPSSPYTKNLLDSVPAMGGYRFV